FSGGTNSSVTVRSSTAMGISVSYQSGAPVAIESLGWLQRSRPSLNISSRPPMKRSSNNPYAKSIFSWNERQRPCTYLRQVTPLFESVCRAALVQKRHASALGHVLPHQRSGIGRLNRQRLDTGTVPGG